MVALPVSSAPSTHQIAGKNLQLQTQDFIKMMVTQLQNQDPLEPAKSQDLLAQMSQIGQLQANTSMQDTLKALVLQNQIGSAGNLIGKEIEGVDDTGAGVSGLVTSVRVQNNTVNLELDNGKTLPLTQVTKIAGQPVAPAPASLPAPAPAATAS